MWGAFLPQSMYLPHIHHFMFSPSLTVSKDAFPPKILSLNLKAVAGRIIVPHPLFNSNRSYASFSGSAYIHSLPLSIPKWVHNSAPISGLPMDTSAKLILLFAFARSSSFRLVEYCNICSWQKGHPNDRVRTINDMPLSLLDEIKLDMEMGDPSNWYTVAWDKAVLGLIDLAAGEGAPEIMVAEPHSHVVSDEERSEEGDDGSAASWRDWGTWCRVGANADAFVARRARPANVRLLPWYTIILFWALRLFDYEDVVSTLALLVVFYEYICVPTPLECWRLLNEEGWKKMSHPRRGLPYRHCLSTSEISVGVFRRH